MYHCISIHEFGEFFSKFIIEKSTALLSQNSFVHDIISLLKKCQPSLTAIENFNIMKSESSFFLVADIGLFRYTFFKIYPLSITAKLPLNPHGLLFCSFLPFRK